MSAGGAKGETRVVQLGGARLASVRRSAEARATVPDLELSTDVELATIADEHLTAALVRASASALRAMPEVNAAYRDAHLELYSRINVAFAVDVGDAYVFPVVFDADAKPLAECSEEIDALTRAASLNELTAPAFAGATFTVTHIAREGIAAVSAITIPPQAAALAAGPVRCAPIVRDGTVLAGRLLTLTLAFDARALHVPVAADFIATVKASLE